MLHTFLYTADSLDRAQDYLLADAIKRIYHIQQEFTHQDQYVALVDCNERDAVYLSLFSEQ